MSLRFLAGPGRSARAACLAALMVAPLLGAQTPGGSQSSPGSSDQVPIEVFKGPRAKRLSRVGCGLADSQMEGSRVKPPPPGPECKGEIALINGTEGWVEFNFMVDTTGKPLEVTVVDSSGSTVLEQAAAAAISKSIFEPGSFNGVPIESDLQFKYVFRSGMGNASGASHQFINEFKSLLNSIRSGDRSDADAALKALQVTNLYEDAFYGVALYNYAQKWGTESEQLTGLRRAIAYENGPDYLPATMFKGALLACLNLELKARQYSEALETWKRLQKSGIDAATLASLAPAIDQLQKIRVDDSEYDVPGKIGKSPWHLHLFKRHFRATVSNGYISQVKLRCDKRYVFFAFDPTLQYEIADKDGKCFLELDGAPGTEFTLSQF